MIGIFDSGVGGLCAFHEVRRRLPHEDIAYLADTKNAPYGTKSKEELKRLVSDDIKRLVDIGARKILIACCTASTVWNELDDEEREISVPIILPAAECALKKSKRIAVISTKYTFSSHAFTDCIRHLSNDATVSERPMQSLVALIEGCHRIGRMTEALYRELERIAEFVKETHSELLILGCTHFSHVEGELNLLMPNVTTVSPAREGAILFSKMQKNSSPHECGRTVYL